MKLLKKGLALLLLVIIVGGAVTLRVIWAGEKEIAASTDLLKKGNAEGAIVHARAAALWYAPGAPHVRVAYGRMMALGKEAEHRKLWDTALAAYRAVVDASTSTRWIGRPHDKEAEEATRAIARIDAHVGVRPNASSTDPPEVVERAALAALEQDPGPSRFYAVVLAISFVSLVAGLAALLRFGLDESGRLRIGRALPAVAAASAGLIGYCVALFFA